MIDKKIVPIYVDPWLGPYKGDAMDITGKHLTDPILRGWLLALIKEEDYTLPELIELVTDAHEKAGGIKPTIPVELLEQRFHAALDLLTAEGWIGNGQNWDEASWTLLVGPPEDADLPMLQEKKARKEGEAEITIGEGLESVYGWYLPAYRELAALKGETHFPMKVGTTTAKPFRRMQAHIGTAPEKPVLGFVWKIKHAQVLEKWLHIE